jgi:hypothetical protein
MRRLAEISTSQRKVSQANSYAELLQYFLLHGTLPWWADGTGIHIDAISKQVISEQSAGFLQFLQANRANASLWQRISYQLPADVQEYVFSQFEELTYAGRQFEEWLAQLFPSSYPGQSMDQDIQREAIRQVLLDNAYAIIENKEVKNLVTGIFIANASRLTNGKTPDLSRIFTKEDIEKGTNKNPVINREVSVIPELPKSLVMETWFIKHAGIVLLTPFLQSFYFELGLLEGTSWKNNEARFRAIHILKFLATGIEKLPEYNFAFEKLICGTHIEEPIPLDISLGEKELTEVQLLLDSVIQHWKALKNTSINGLRETFLKRDGIISRKENGWLVQIERKTWDVLLEKMPWGYSTIALPWNDYIIYTEW